MLLGSSKDFSPIWQQSFLFATSQENEILFNHESALIIEFYPFQKSEILTVLSCNLNHHL